MRIFPIGLAAAAVLASAVSADSQTLRLDDRGFSFKFGSNDRRGDVEGKRASCEVYARIAQVQADANDRLQVRISRTALGPRFKTPFHVVPAGSPPRPG